MAASLPTYGFRQGYERDWTESWAEVIEFTSHADALRFNDFANHMSCPSAGAVISVPVVSGSTGLRILRGSGEVQDRVSFVRGPRWFSVSVVTKTPLDRTAVSTLDRLTDRYAR